MRKLIFSCLFLFVALWANALPTRLYDTEQLSSNLITSLCQDQQGYIWIGTEYGLNKFDGVHVIQYYNDIDNPQSLSDDLIRKLMTDDKGRLWVVTNLGVQRYNRMYDNFESVVFPGSLTANINDILQTPEGKIWLLTAADGIFEVDEETMEAKAHDALNKRILNVKECDNMYLDKKGRMWISYRDEGLQMIDTKSDASHLYASKPLQDTRAVDIIEDDNGLLTVVTYSALLQLNEQTKEFETVVTFPRTSVHHIYKEKSGTMLIGTSGSGIMAVDMKTKQLKSLEDPKVGFTSLRYSRVHAIMEDRNGNKWFGCFQIGLLFVSNNQYPFHFLPLSQMDCYNSNVLRTVYADRNDNVYICQENGGITSVDNQGRSRCHYMGNHTVMTISEDKNGNLWVGSFRNGLFRVNLQSGSEEWISLSGSQRIGSITFDNDGNLYTAVFGEGLRSYTPDGKTERILGKANLKLFNTYLNKLFTDKEGRIWIGHYYGIDVYDPKTDQLMDVNIPDALRPAIVYTIVQSPKDHSMWIGSNKGLFQYVMEGKEKGQWKRFTNKNGLTNDVVCGLVVTDDGTLWASTYRGVTQIDSDGQLIRYYRGNGLEEWSYLRGVYTVTVSGIVIFGNQNGITYFNPRKMVKDTFDNKIMLTAMRLGNTNVNAMTLSNGRHIITKALDESDEISVSYLDNTFSLRFSSMDFRDAQNVHYEFRFVGEPDDQWYQTESGRSEIFFSHLAIGTHKLVVRAYDNGIYSPEKVIMIHVTPPWYRSWGAYAFYLMLLAAIAALWWRYYWSKRQAETNEEKIKFFVDISHELRSPLTLIKSPLDKLLRTTTDPTQIRALRNIDRNTNRLLTLVNQILSIRKIEKGQMTMHFSKTMLGDFVNDICNDYNYQTEKRNLTLSFENQVPDMEVWIDRDNFDKVVTNLIGNAIKYVDDGGEIKVKVMQSNSGNAILEVSDNGPGIDENQLTKIFERFYQASARPAAGQMSYGIGLNLSQKIVSMHGGTISAHNRTDSHGSIFVVTLPLGNTHLPQDQLVDSDYFDVPAETESKTPPVLDADRPRHVRKKTTYHIAVVDDDEEIRSFLQTELSEIYHVHVYADGRKALEGILDQVPDLVVSDVVMPNMDGFELLKRIKSSSTTSHVPVILLTTKSEHQSRIKGLEQGADAYIDKPFNLEELEVIIAGLIANRIRIRGKFSGVQEQENTIRKVELKGNDAALMEKIMKAVNERIDDSDFNVEALAEEVGLSRVQLHRRMKELTGITVGEFIRNLRLQQAAQLLEKGDTTVAQVTYAVGFANPTHFTATFKKHFGVTPSEYMAKHKDQK